MVLDTTIEKLNGRAGTDAALTDGAEDISGGVTQEVDNVASFTLFLSASGAVDVTVEFSPDGGTTWYEPAAESPVVFGAAGDDLVHVEYNATDVRLTGSNGTTVEAQLREVV